MRGTDCAPRHVTLGSTLAYCQLLIHAIQMRRPSLAGTSENESDA